MMKVLIKKEGFHYRKGEKKTIIDFVEKVLQQEKREGEVSIFLTHNKRIESLNFKYRLIAAPTDVLSFPQDLPDFLGDIVISMEMAEERARDEGCPPLEVVLNLVLHGLLHLLGYDHKEEEEASLMEEKEEMYRNKFLYEALT